MNQRETELSLGKILAEPLVFAILCALEVLIIIPDLEL